jgi:hypothetical protein
MEESVRDHGPIRGFCKPFFGSVFERVAEFSRVQGAPMRGGDPAIWPYTVLNAADDSANSLRIARKGERPE